MVGILWFHPKGHFKAGICREMTFVVSGKVRDLCIPKIWKNSLIPVLMSNSIGSDLSKNLESIAVP
jgi:hypothetical protein